MIHSVYFFDETPTCLVSIDILFNHTQKTHTYIIQFAPHEEWLCISIGSISNIIIMFIHTQIKTMRQKIYMCCLLLDCNIFIEKEQKQFFTHSLLRIHSTQKCK